MPNVHSMLCPVDLSDQSRRALFWAGTIARRRGATLTVLSVLEPLLARAAEIRLGIDLARQRADPTLRLFVQATVPGGLEGIDVRTDVAVEPSAAILSAGRRLQTDLIVMGTHGRGWLGRRLFGSTAEDVLRHADRPVLVVPPTTEPLDGEHPGRQLKAILMATDFGEAAVPAFAWAAGLASDVGVPLVLAQVVEPVMAPPRWQHLAAEFEGDRVAAGQRMLETMTHGVPDARSVVSIGRPADTIASLALKHGAGLIVLGLVEPGTHRAGAIASRVMRLTHVPVAVVPSSRTIVAEQRAAPGADAPSRVSFLAGH
jgi:nucleotide-binding universal stress UspA family protein